MNHKTSQKNYFENGFELLLLGLIFLSILFQLILGNENVLSLILRNFSVAGMMFLGGYYISNKTTNALLLFKKGLFYVSFFLFFGFLHQVIIYNNNVFKSLLWLITLLKIPEPSDIFFTVSVIFLSSAVLYNKLNSFKFKKIPLCFLCILALGIVFIPATTFDYAIIGVFLGTDNYNCIPLLPFIGFYFAGFFSQKYQHNFSKKTFVVTTLITLFSVPLYATPFQKTALITFSALPVYLIFIFTKNCKWYQKLANLPLHILDCITKRCYSIFFGFDGKLKKTIPVYITIYSFCFCLISLLVFSPFWASESSLIWDHDALSQYVPKAYYYMEYIHNLVNQFLQGNFEIPTYDFQIGFGGPITFNTEPLFLLLALFPESKVEFAYGFISILRLYFAGLSISALLLYFKKEHYDTLLGSLIYIFSGFALYSTVIHAQFISPMILFPLLIIATEEIFQKKRWYLCTILVAISLLSNYYFAYMNTLAIGLYFLSRFIFTKDKSKKNIKYFLSATGMFAASYLLGVLIGNLSLFTSFASYLGSGRTGSVAASTPSLLSYGVNLPTKLWTSFISPPGNTGFSSKYGFIPLVYIAIVVLFLKKEQKMLKFLFVLYTAFCLFPFAGLVFSGFSVVINRWGFMYALLVSFITACILPKLRSLTKRELGILFLSIVPLAPLIIFNGDYLIESAPVGLIMLLLSYIVILFINENIAIIRPEHSKKVLLTLCILSIIVNSHLQYTIGDTSVPDNFVSKGETLTEIKNTPLSAAETIEDDSFYRVATTDIETRNLNSSLVMDFNGINIFASTVDSSLVDFNTAMANSTWSMILYQGFDNRTFLNTLANVKYYTTLEEFKGYIPYGYKFSKDETINGTTYFIYENEYALPLGYTYSSTISEEELSNYSPLEQQEILLQSASVDNNSSTTKLSTDNIYTNAEEITLIDYEASNGVEFTDTNIVVTEEDATLTLYFKSLPNSETYIEYTGADLSIEKPRSENFKFDIMQNDNEIYSYTMRAKENTYTTGQDTYVYNLGYHEDSLNRCTITFKDIGTLRYDALKLYSQPMDSYESYIKALTEDTLENVEISSNTVTGTISLSEEKLLVLGIPYQNGWTAYVDGQEIEIQKANYMFSGLFLDSGNHTIELHYELPGIKVSLLLTALGIIIFIAALFIRRKNSK